MDKDTIAARDVLAEEIKAGRDVVDCMMIISRIDAGKMRAELLPERDVDEERAACDIPYGRHIGDFLLHYI